MQRRPRFLEVGYRPDLLVDGFSIWLDHIRWVAAAAVAAYHLRTNLMPEAAGAMPAAERLFYFLTGFGIQAVVIFFVLSGMLVGGVIIRYARSGTFPWSKYFLDRGTRIYLVVLPAVLFSLIMQASVASANCTAWPDVPQIMGNLLLLQNLAVGPLCNNDPLWSLSSEAYFYIIGPVLILCALGQGGVRLKVVAVLLLVPGIVFLGHTFRAPLFGLFLWLLGLIPWFVRIRIPAALPIVALAAILTIGRLRLLNEFLEQSLLAGTFVLLLCSNFQLLPGKGRELGKFIAAFSYSLYATHMPIVDALAGYFGKQRLPAGQWHTYLVVALSFAGLLVFGWLFSRSFEAQTARVRKLAVHRRVLATG